MQPKIHMFFLATEVAFLMDTRGQKSDGTPDMVKQSEDSNWGQDVQGVLTHMPASLSVVFSVWCLVCLYSCPCLLLVFPLNFYVTAYMSPLSIPKSGSVSLTGRQNTREQRKHTQTHAAVHSAAVRLQTQHIRNWRKEKQAAVERDGEGNRGEGGAGSGWEMFEFVCVSKLHKQTGP